MITTYYTKLCQYYLKFLVISFICSTVGFEIMASEAEEQSELINQLTYRLPKEVVPTLYELYLHPNFESYTFTGSEKIYIDVTDPVKFIVLHSIKLVISDTKLYNESGNRISIKATFEHKPLEYLIIVPTSEIAKGKYVLELNFNGDYSNRFVSLYGSTYYDKLTSQSRKIVTSKFQPTYTRHAFPCFDEPAIKAQFEITLVRPSGNIYHALSNMNIVHETSHPQDDSLTIVKFARSIPMTAYLLCFIISDFASKEYLIPSHEVGQDVHMRVFSAKSEISKTKFSAELGCRVIQYYLNYFNIPYPLPKLDMVAIPDYLSEATENWGLITFRDGLFLYDPEVVSSESKQYTMILIVHEIAHMWFGNLVTLEWWDQLWLNEGFTSFMEYKCGDVMYPQYKMFDQMIIDIQNVLAIDSTVASYPIVLSVENSDQISEIFNPITYLKAAAVIRMLEDFVGERDFRNSISNFLKAHEYSIANSTNLINEIEKVVPNLDIKSFLNTWIYQKGFPYIEVHHTNNCNVYKLTQHRFLIGNGSTANDTHSDYNYRWEILVTYYSNISQAKDLQRKLFSWQSDSLDIVVEDNHSWIKLNKNRIGYYRVLYSNEIWYQLIDQLKTYPNTFSVSDRANLIDDAFSLAEAKLLSYEVVMDLLQYLINEKDFVPWCIASIKLNSIFGILDSPELTSKLKETIKTLIDPVYQYVGWDFQTGDDFHLKNRLRSVILELACNVGHDKCLERAKQEFLIFLDNPSIRPHPDIRRIVYYYGINKAGNHEVWNKMWQLLVHERAPQEQIKLMYGLSAIQDSNILNNLLKLMNNETNVIRDHDYFNYLEYVAGNKLGAPLVWSFFQNDWQYLVNRFSLNSRYFGRAVGNILSKFNSLEQYNEVVKFFKLKPESGAGAGSRIRALENIKNNMDWLKRNGEVLLQWLNRNR